MIPIARATIARSLMMYCPSSVGTSGWVHATLATITSGDETIPMWMRSNATEIRVIAGMRKSTPMTHSYTASALKDVVKYCIPMVWLVSAMASGVAGLSPRSFSEVISAIFS
jgi:hypothetical protein